MELDMDADKNPNTEFGSWITAMFIIMLAVIITAAIVGR
jgi:hypothetical protein